VSYCGMSDSAYLRDSGEEDLEIAARSCTSAVAQMLGQVESPDPCPEEAMPS